jgi:hypothetical protein
MLLKTTKIKNKKEGEKAFSNDKNKNAQKPNGRQTTNGPKKF